MNDTFAISMLGMDFERLRLELTAMNLANVNGESTLGNAYKPKSIDPTLFERVFNGMLERELSIDQVSDLVIKEGSTKTQYNPDSPFADEKGLVEVPDLSPLTEMLNVMKAERAYEANAKVFNASRLMVKEALKMGQ